MVPLTGDILYHGARFNVKKDDFMSPTPQQVNAGQAVYTDLTLMAYDVFVLGFRIRGFGNARPVCFGHTMRNMSAIIISRSAGHRATFLTSAGSLPLFRALP